MTPAAVLFDLDDTLVDQRTAAHTAVRGWAAALGVTGPGVVARWDRVTARHYGRYQRRELDFAGQRRERVREFLDDATLSGRAADDLFAGYLRRYEAAWTVFDDAVPTLRRARAAGLRVAVLTNGEHDQQRRKLDRLGLAPEVDLLVASSRLPAGKPHPDAFRHTVERLGVAVAAAVMVGDNLPDDVLAARAAGLGAVLLDRAGVHSDAGVPRIRSLQELTLS